MTATIRAASVGAALILVAVLPEGAAAQRHHSSSARHFHHRPVGTRLIVVAPFVPFGYYSPPPLVYSTPVVYSAPPTYYSAPPTYYSPPPTYYGPPPAYYGPPPAAAPLHQDVQPIQREVVFPTGRYVLRGDGVSTPYTWVWIPNPPTAPPGAPSSSVPGSANIERPIYSWTDANGVTTWTDRLSKVPP